MTYTDELRELAEEVELIEPDDGVEHRAEFADWLKRTAERLNALADKLQNKVVVRPIVEQWIKRRNMAWHATILHNDSTGPTEAEAIANLQAQLDAADNNA